METIAHSDVDSGGFVHNKEAHSSGVAWGAVLGGAFVAAAFYLILLALGAGFGLSAVSPWSNAGASATTLETGAIVWLVFTEVMAAALGGYLTGRLRIKWASIHTDEVHFRDTANGFLAWAVALVLSVSFLLSTAASIVGGHGQLRSSAESAPATSVVDPNAYFVDKLLRSDRFGSENSDIVARAEAGRILAKGLHKEPFPAADQDYLARLTAAKAGINSSEAAKRVSDVIAEVREAEETARRLAARLLVWTFFALMMGAFSASSPYLNCPIFRVI